MIAPNLDSILQQHPHATRDSLIPLLQEVQERLGFLSHESLVRIGEHLKLPASKVYGVATFYNQFRHQPVGEHIIRVCHGTACHVAGAPLIVEALSQELEIAVGDTTPDMLFTLQTVNCVGACALAPVVRIGDDDTHGRVTPNAARKLVRRLRKAEVA